MLSFACMQWHMCVIRSPTHASWLDAAHQHLQIHVPLKDIQRTQQVACHCLTLLFIKSHLGLMQVNGTQCNSRLLM
jgi:uncharacterized membrane protein